MRKIPTIAFATLLFSCQSAADRNREHIDSLITEVKTAHIADSMKMEIKTNALKKAMNSAWSYDSTVDEMTSRKTYFAQIDAKDLLEFGFPYNGGSVATLTIRKMNGKSAVILGVSKGQFMASVEGQVINVRFDDAPAEEFNTSRSGDDDPKVLFVDAASSFIARAKKAKVIKIKATFYNEGAPVMEFNTEGLQWNH